MSLTVEQLVAAIRAINPAWTITEYGKSIGATMEWLGIIPLFLDLNDPRPAAEQIDSEYQHGGGWRPLDNGKWKLDRATGMLLYDDQDDPETYRPIAEAKLRDERLYFYDCAWVAIVQPDGSFEVSRLD